MSSGGWDSDDVDDVDDVDNVMIMVLMKVMMTVNVMALFLLVSQRQADLCIMNHPGRLFMTMMMILVMKMLMADYYSLAV